MTLVLIDEAVASGARLAKDTARIAPFEAVELDIGRLFPPAARTTP